MMRPPSRAGNGNRLKTPRLMESEAMSRTVRIFSNGFAVGAVVAGAWLAFTSLSTLCGLVGQGLGLTFLPELAVATETAAMPGIGVRRFAGPEPFRRIALVRRATTDGDGWFAALTEVLGDAGRGMVGETRL